MSDRAARDLAAIYEFIQVDSSRAAFAWFNALCDAIDSLRRFPDRGTVTPEGAKLRHLLFGQNPDVYRIIYRVEKRRAVVDVLHIRHGARAPFSEPDARSGSADK